MTGKLMGKYDALSNASRREVCKGLHFKRNRSYNLSYFENNLMFEFHQQIHSKIVLVVVAPHCGIASLARLGARNPLSRSNEKSIKLSNAR